LLVRQGERQSPDDRCALCIPIVSSAGARLRDSASRYKFAAAKRASIVLPPSLDADEEISMNRRTMQMGLRWGMTGLAALVAACGGESDDEQPASGSGGEERVVVNVEPRQSATDQLIAGLGGRAALGALTGLRIQGTGSRFIPNEGVTPEDPAIEANSFERTVSIDLGADALRVDTSRDIEFLFPGSQQYSDIVRGNLGASTQPFFGTPLGALGSDKTASIRRQEVLLTPQLLLRELDTAIFTTQADVVLDGVNHHRVVASGGPAPVTLLINADTGMLSKLETLEHDFYQRDALLEIFYADWAPAGSTAFPRSLRVVRGGQTLFTQQVTAVEVDPAFDAATFEFPEGAAPAFDAALFARGELSHQWYYLLDSIGLPFNGVDTSITPVEVAPGVLQLVGGSHHSLLLQQEAGLVLVDAPLYEDRGAALVEFAETEFPGTPIAYVVASHFHEDHASGIREVLGRTGATLVVHESVEPFWRELLAAPSTLRPDALAASKGEIEILTVPDGGERELPDATRPVTLYHLATDHAADMLLTHEPASNTVFVVDIYSPGNAAQLGASDLASSLAFHAIPRADLKIVGGHGGQIDDYADLEAALDPAPAAP
jgi:glyoxylase-like metal-dependent hydrolase (beta-lactamase superfamily II)